MLIDWFTVLAQAINFLVLVWLLKRFLFKPVVMAMDAREQRVAAELRNAAVQQTEAKAQSEKFRMAQAEFEQKKQTLLHQAEVDAESLRQRLSEEARQEIETLRRKWRDALGEEQIALGLELSDRVQREVFSIARQVLRDLAGAELERQIVTRFVGRLRTLDDGEKDNLIELLLKQDQPAVIRSAFALPTAFRTEIEGAVAGLQPGLNPQRIQYEIATDLLGGIELATDGRKISWSIAGYLTALEQAVRRIADQGTVSDERAK
jgi:F-type H+-transporting ATPase subunit b